MTVRARARRGGAAGGCGFVVDRACFEAGTRPGQALMIGSSDELIERILDANRVLGRLDRFSGVQNAAICSRLPGL